MAGALVTGLASFGVLAADDALHGPISQGDAGVNAAVGAWQASGIPVHAIGAALTALGDGLTVTACIALAAAYMLAHRQWALAAWCVAIGVTNSLAVDLLKAWFQRARPPVFGDLRHSYSFPSGHTFGATAGLGAAFILTAEVYRRSRAAKARRAYAGHPVPAAAVPSASALPPNTAPPVRASQAAWTRSLWAATLAAWALLALATGIGRVLAQEHWLSDVMASWALGVALVAGLLLGLSMAAPDGDPGPQGPPTQGPPR